MLGMEPVLIADVVCTTGEGPLWHPRDQKLYWVDIPPGKLFCYDPAAKAHELVFQASEAIGGFTFQADGTLLLFMARGAIQVLHGGMLTPLVREIPADRETRFNDVIADPAGRVFCGTMPSPARSGRLYRLDLDGSLTQVVDGVGVSNGLGFTPDLRQMYYTDTTKGEISLFDYDKSTGDISNRRTFVSVADGEGHPDGMTVDAEGCVWSARWDGGCLVRYAPDGRELRRIAFPARKVSSATFGGDDYADLYVTTATGGRPRSEEGTGAGALFCVRTGVHGVPEFESRIGLL